MKKLVFIFIAYITFFSQVNAQNKGDNKNYEVKDGMLSFRDKNAMNDYIDKYYNLSSEEQKKVDNSNKVSSLHIIYNEVIDSEDALEKEYIDKNKIFKGGIIPHSDVYKKALNQGAIIEKPDTLKSVSVDLNICFHSYKYILNKNRMVIIADTLYQFEKNKIKSIPYKNKNQIEELLQNKKTPNLDIFELTTQSTQGQPSGQCVFYNWSVASSWIYLANNKRVMHEIKGIAKGNCQCGPWANVVFTYSFDAKRKNFFGTWVHSNQFTPNFSMNGNWATDSEVTTNPKECLQGYTPYLHCSLSTPVSPNSFSGTAFGFSRNYCPHGTWIANNGNWVHVPHVTSKTFNCTVNGNIVLPILH